MGDNTGIETGLVVDLFAGGGGASVGLEAALGRPVDLAINHDPVALAVHTANHPRTLHLTADIWEVAPREATGGAPVDVLWASPDCTHFSVAKGDVPRSKSIRSLAWVVVRWAAAVRPRIIFLENVQEFRGWGPLEADGRPDKRQMGFTFHRWRRALERLGYAVDYRVLDASAYGAPTRRRRLFLVARRDGLPIRWPAPTHGPGLEPVHTAAECIDWSLPCPSIFERKRPLAEKTLWRIAQGIRRFVLESPRPFILKFRGQSHSSDSLDPMPTITAGSGPGRPAGAGHALGVVVPTIVEVNHGRQEARVRSAAEPLATVTAARRGSALVATSLVGVGGRAGDSPPMSPAAPLGTVTSKGDRALVAASLVQSGYGERPGQAARTLDIKSPLGTVVAEGQKHLLVAAFLAKHFGGVVGLPLESPLSTVTATDHHAVVSAGLAVFRGTSKSHPGISAVEEPLPTVTAGGNHVAEVRAFLTAYYGEDGTGGQSLLEPARTITARHRLGLVTVEGRDYQIEDIGMRMLEPHELLAAQFGRFAAFYDLSAAASKASKVRLIGNSVCPEVAESVVRANVEGAVTAAAAEGRIA